jgi:hypothetical protein
MRHRLLSSARVQGYAACCHSAMGPGPGFATWAGSARPGGAAALPAKEPGEPLMGTLIVKDLGSGFGEFPRLQVQ